MCGEELKPCPFCGGEARIEIEYNETKKAWYTQAKCKTCFSKSLVIKTLDDPNKHPDVFNMIRRIWNKRYNETL